MKKLLITTTIILSLFGSYQARADAPPVGDPLAGRKTTPAPAVVTAPVPVVAPAAPKEAKLVTTPVSVLERFRTHTGPRTPAALSELFSAPTAAGIRQEPEIVLSNGAVTASIAAVLPDQGNAAPNFAFNGARLIANTRIKKDEWLIEALPETGVLKAEMIILSNGVALEVPVTVAPPLPAETDLSEKGFIAFLGVAGKDSRGTPLLDLNGDGRRDYLDDFIFTANYLVSKRSDPVVSDSAPSAGAEEPRDTQAPNQVDPGAVPAPVPQTAGAAASNEQQTGAWQPSPGGWAANPQQTPATVQGVPYTVSTSNTTGSDGTTGDTTGGTAGGTTDGTTRMHTITSPSGKTLTYIGSKTPSNLNLRNLKAKEQKDLLNSTNK